jgi:hypothetical protein
MQRNVRRTFEFKITGVALVCVARSQQRKSLPSTARAGHILIPYLFGKFSGSRVTFSRIDILESFVDIGFGLSNRLDYKKYNRYHDYGQNDGEPIKHLDISRILIQLP